MPSQIKLYFLRLLRIGFQIFFRHFAELLQEEFNRGITTSGNLNRRNIAEGRNEVKNLKNNT